MKEKKEKMLPVPLRSLNPKKGFEAPLFVYLSLNDRFVPIRLSGDPLGPEMYRRLVERKFTELWTWAKDFDLPEGAEESRPSPDKASVRTDLRVDKVIDGSGSMASQTDRADTSSLFEDETLVADVLREKELSQEEKAKILSGVGKQFLGVASRLRSTDKAEQEVCIKRAKLVVDQILQVASEQSDIYSEILSIRQSQEEIEHSTMVGTLAAMFALSIGYSDEKLLSDIVAAALFHDVGLVEIKGDFLFKSELEWSQGERLEYEAHVGHSARLIEESTLDFHPRVLRMIREHHEYYDGSGFPRGLKGAQIDETSQLLVLANYFDRICSGRGVEQAPFAEAFEQVFGDKKKDERFVASPELIQRIYQFSMREQAAAEEIRLRAGQLAQETGADHGVDGET